MEISVANLFAGILEAQMSRRARNPRYWISSTIFLMSIGRRSKPPMRALMRSLRSKTGFARFLRRSRWERLPRQEKHYKIRGTSQNCTIPKNYF